MRVAERNWRKEKERDAILFPKTKTNRLFLRSFTRNSSVVQSWFSFVTTYCGILPECSLVLYLFLSGRHFSTILKSDSLLIP